MKSRRERQARQLLSRFVEVFSMRKLQTPPGMVGSIVPPCSTLSVALPRPADVCYPLYCDIERVPEWLPIVRSAVVTSRDAQGRPSVVAFLARLRGATIGYSCRYRYDKADRYVDWSTSEGASITVQGWAQFAPLGDRATLMTYSLELDLGPKGALPGWNDSFFDGHPASTAMHDFREYVSRVT